MIIVHSSKIILAYVLGHCQLKLGKRLGFLEAAQTCSQGHSQISREGGTGVDGENRQVPRLKNNQTRN